jgi:DNA uptake protein ComE-like DNA-binding protein
MFGGCTSREKSPEQIRENTAKATSKIKENTVAVAQGVKEGLTKPNAVDLNSASKAQLTSLPGVDGSIADRIVAARPYDNPDQLVSKRVLSNAQYDQVKDRVAVRK